MVKSGTILVNGEYRKLEVYSSQMGVNIGRRIFKLSRLVMGPGVNWFF